MNQSGLLESHRDGWGIHCKVIELTSNDFVQILGVFGLNFTIVEHMVNVMLLLVQNCIFCSSSLDDFSKLWIDLVYVLYSKFSGFINISLCFISDDLKVFNIFNNMIDYFYGFSIAINVVNKAIVNIFYSLEGICSGHRTNVWNVLQTYHPLRNIYISAFLFKDLPIAKLIWVRIFIRCQCRSGEIRIKCDVG
jgi:hypothetical protein